MQTLPQAAHDQVHVARGQVETELQAVADKNLVVFVCGMIYLKVRTLNRPDKPSHRHNLDRTWSTSDINCDKNMTTFLRDVHVFGLKMKARIRRVDQSCFS